jgi:hypothetical protein
MAAESDSHFERQRRDVEVTEVIQQAGKLDPFPAMVLLAERLTQFKDGSVGGNRATARLVLRLAMEVQRQALLVLKAEEEKPTQWKLDLS